MKTILSMIGIICLIVCGVTAAHGQMFESTMLAAIGSGLCGIVSGL